MVRLLTIKERFKNLQFVWRIAVIVIPSLGTASVTVTTWLAGLPVFIITSGSIVAAAVCAVGTFYTLAALERWSSYKITKRLVLSDFKQMIADWEGQDFWTQGVDDLDFSTPQWAYARSMLESLREAANDGRVRLYGREWEKIPFAAARLPFIRLIKPKELSRQMLDVDRFVFSDDNIRIRTVDIARREPVAGMSFYDIRADKGGLMRWYRNYRKQYAI